MIWVLVCALPSSLDDASKIMAKRIPMIQVPDVIMMERCSWFRSSAAKGLRIVSFGPLALGEQRMIPCWIRPSMPMRIDRPCKTFLKLWNPIHAMNHDCWSDWGHSMTKCYSCCYLIFVSSIVDSLPFAPLRLWRASSKIPRGYPRSCTCCTGHRCYRPMRQRMMISSWFVLQFDCDRRSMCTMCKISNKLSRIDDECKNLRWICSSREAMRGSGISDVFYSIVPNDEKFTTVKSRVESIGTWRRKNHDCITVKEESLSCVPPYLTFRDSTASVANSIFMSGDVKGSSNFDSLKADRP